MRKIMFNDKYGLTKAVLEGRKTCSRRLVPEGLVNIAYSLFGNDEGDDWKTFILAHSRYKVGEEVAVAQSYRAMIDELEFPTHSAYCAEHWEINAARAGALYGWLDHPGANNKMFVRADHCIHRIKITGVRLEELQDITDDDCLREGIYRELNGMYTFDNWTLQKYGTKYAAGGPRVAFEFLINKVAGRDIWDADPLVYVFDFELVK